MYTTRLYDRTDVLLSIVTSEKPDPLAGCTCRGSGQRILDKGDIPRLVSFSSVLSSFKIVHAHSLKPTIRENMGTCQVNGEPAAEEECAEGFKSVLIIVAAVFGLLVRACLCRFSPLVTNLSSVASSCFS
jgi:hypothetical protein